MSTPAPVSPVNSDPPVSAPAPVGPVNGNPQKTRLEIFATLFKSYMGVMPIVAAALAPLLTAMNVLPVYETERKPLATMAGVLGFLLLAWIFYVRRTIALGSIRRYYRTLFNVTPLLLIAISIVCYVAYSETLGASVDEVIRDHPAANLQRTTVLGSWTMENDAPYAVELQLLYLAMFLSAEAAFVMMAMREYAIDVLGISEYDWIYGAQDGSDPRLPKPDSPR